MLFPAIMFSLRTALGACRRNVYVSDLAGSAGLMVAL
jgi:hypothetical protein